MTPSIAPIHSPGPPLAISDLKACFFFLRKRGSQGCCHVCQALMEPIPLALDKGSRAHKLVRAAWKDCQVHLQWSLVHKLVCEGSVTQGQQF